MALGPEFYQKMYDRIKRESNRGDLFAEAENNSRCGDDLLQQPVYTESGDDVEIIDIDISEIDPVGDGALNLAFASTIDTVTQRTKLHYVYYSDRHKKAINHLFASIMNYISSTIPVGANMLPDDFFVYVTNFYRDRVQGFVDDPEGNKTSGVIEFYNTKFTKIQVSELLTSIEKFIESADNATELKDICTPLHVLSVRDKQNKMDLFRGMASVITEPELTPGDENFGKKR